MKFYNDLLIRHLSTEGVEKESAPNIKPEPPGDRTIEVTISKDGMLDQEALTALHQMLSLMSVNETMSVEAHDPTNIQRFMGKDIDTDDNYVVNGVYLPDYIADDNAKVPVVLIDHRTKMSSLKDDIVYYVMDDFHSEDIVTKLRKLGFVAVNTPLDLGKAIADATARTVV